MLRGTINRARASRASATVILKNVFLVMAMIGTLSMMSACSSDYSKLKPLPTNIRPESPAATGLAPYRIQVGDVLELKLRLNPELDETVTVRPDGMISTAMAADIPAYDRTVSELNDSLVQIYGEELRNPKISTIVRSFAPTRIYVGGEVENPGEFVVVGPALTLTQAIARAGGLKNSAQANKVLVMRRGAGEQGETFVADYDAATQGGDPRRDARLAPYDVVFVPKNGGALAYKQYEQYFKQYASPGVGVSYSLGNN